MTENMYLWRIWNIKVAIFILEQRWIFKPHCTANDTWSISSSTSEVSEPCRPAHRDSLKLQDSVLELIALRWATSRHQQVTASTWGVKMGTFFRIHRHGHWERNWYGIRLAKCKMWTGKYICATGANCCWTMGGVDMVMLLGVCDVTKMCCKIADDAKK